MSSNVLAGAFECDLCLLSQPGMMPHGQLCLGSRRKSGGRRSRIIEGSPPVNCLTATNSMLRLGHGASRVRHGRAQDLSNTFTPAKYVPLNKAGSSDGRSSYPCARPAPVRRPKNRKASVAEVAAHGFRKRYGEVRTKQLVVARACQTGEVSVKETETSKPHLSILRTEASALRMPFDRPDFWLVWWTEFLVGAFELTLVIRFSARQVSSRGRDFSEHWMSVNPPTPRMACGSNLMLFLT